MFDADERLSRIALAHQKAVDDAGGTWGECTECGWVWPCPTYWWATEPHIVDPVLRTWDPKDEEVPDDDD